MDFQFEMKQDGKTGQFFKEQEGEKLAFMEFSLKDDQRMVIDHTVVDPSLKGQGVGKALVEEAATWARENQFRILPVCSFAKHVMEKDSARYADVLV